MAYISQTLKKELTPAIKAVLKKYDMKGTISIAHHSKLVVTLRSGSMFKGLTDTSVNYYHINSDKRFDEKEKSFLNELRNAMMVGNYDNSDPQSDYFDVGWYIEIKIGNYEKDYIFQG